MPSDADRVFTDAGSASNTTAQAQFLWLYSLEKVAKAGIMDGQNLNSGQTYLNVQIQNGSTNALTYFFLAKMDVIYILDSASGEITTRM